jgi:hypothetical protein
MIADLHINVYRRPFHKNDPDGKKAMARFENTLASAIGYGGTAPDFMLSLGDNVSVCNMGAGMFPEPDKFTKRLSAEYAFTEHLEFLSPRALKEIPMATVQGNHDAVCLPADAEPVGDGNNAFFDLPNDDGYSGHYLEGSSDAATISAGDFFYQSGDLLVVGINAMVGSRGNCTPCAPEVHRAYIEKAIAAHPDARFFPCCGQQGRIVKNLCCHIRLYRPQLDLDLHGIPPLDTNILPWLTLGNKHKKFTKCLAEKPQFCLSLQGTSCYNIK